jgi:hypothetical protein
MPSMGYRTILGILVEQHGYQRAAALVRISVSALKNVLAGRRNLSSDAVSRTCRAVGLDTRERQAHKVTASREQWPREAQLEYAVLEAQLAHERARRIAAEQALAAARASITIPISPPTPPRFTPRV